MKDDLYVSKISTNHKTLRVLKKELLRFLKNNKHIHCRALKRKVYFDKLPDSIISRKSSARRRLQKFDVSIDVLKHSKHWSSRRNKDNQIEYEIIGKSSNEKIIRIHLREEISPQKNKQLYFVSCCV